MVLQIDVALWVSAMTGVVSGMGIVWATWMYDRKLHRRTIRILRFDYENDKIELKRDCIERQKRIILMLKTFIPPDMIRDDYFSQILNTYNEELERLKTKKYDKKDFETPPSLFRKFENDSNGEIVV